MSSITVIEHEQYFDFQDGNGPVPAHKHENRPEIWKQRVRKFSEEGGWVAETATVHPTAYVHPTAEVFGNAVVDENVYIHYKVYVSGKAHICRLVSLCTPCVLTDQAKLRFGFDRGFCQTFYFDRDYAVYIIQSDCYDKFGHPLPLEDIPEGAEVFYCS